MAKSQPKIKKMTMTLSFLLRLCCLIFLFLPLFYQVHIPRILWISLRFRYHFWKKKKQWIRYSQKTWSKKNIKKEKIFNFFTIWKVKEAWKNRFSLVCSILHEHKKTKDIALFTNSLPSFFFYCFFATTIVKWRFLFLQKKICSRNGVSDAFPLRVRIVLL